MIFQIKKQMSRGFIHIKSIHRFYIINLMTKQIILVHSLTIAMQITISLMVLILFQITLHINKSSIESTLKISA